MSPQHLAWIARHMGDSADEIGVAIRDLRSLRQLEAAGTITAAQIRELHKLSRLEEMLQMLSEAADGQVTAP